MRHASLAIAVLVSLAACGEPEPPAMTQPPKPLAQAPAPAPTPPAPAAEPRPSADELLLARVKKALRDTRQVDGQGVSVTVADGTVSLFGTAPSDDARRKIERFVAGVDGVQAVVSKLVIVRGS